MKIGFYSNNLENIKIGWLQDLPINPPSHSLMVADAVDKCKKVIVLTYTGPKNKESPS